MATIRFSLSKKQNEAKMNEILLRLSIDRKHVLRAKTGFFIRAEDWDTLTEKLIIPRLHTNERTKLVILQGKIDSFKNFILQHCVEDEPQIINKSWLVQLIHVFRYGETPSIANDFEAVFKQYVTTQVKTRHGQKLFLCLLRMLQRFELYCGNGFKLELDNLTNEHLTQFEAFLNVEHTFFGKNGKCLPRYSYIYQAYPLQRPPKPRGGNSLFTIFKRFRTFFNWAVRTGKTQNNPFKKYRLKECVYGTPFFMSVEELNQLSAYDLSARPQLAVQRDIFIFQSYVGMRVGDFFELTKANVVDNAIEYIPQKTINKHGDTVRVPLSSHALEILKRYESDERIELLPFISQQKYNEAIKIVLRLAGINRVVTVINPTTRKEEQCPICEVASSHMARRNFIGNIYKKVQDPNAIASMTGHVEGSKAFARYRTVDDDMKRNLIAALE